MDWTLSNELLARSAARAFLLPRTFFFGFHLFSTFVAVESALFGASQQPNFFLNPQVFRGWGLILAADGLCEWLAIFEGSDPSPSPWAPCVVPNYSWIPFNKRQAGRQAGKQAPPP